MDPRHRRLRAPALTALLAALVLPLAATPAAAADFPDRDGAYHNYDEMVADIQAVEAARPEIVDVFSIGTSYQGRDIWAAKISDNVATDEPEKEILVDALHHAREHMTVEQALYLLHLLADNYGTDSLVTTLVDHRETYIIFNLNPDGGEYDLTCTGSARPPYCAWRKNRQPNAGTTARGTDLNRNYDYRWACCKGSSGNPANLMYRGPAPFSAPETRVLRDFVNSRIVDGIQQIRAHVTLHTNGQLILWPYGYTKTNLPADMSAEDHATFVAMGRAMAARNGYRAQQSSDLYVTDGDQIDWMYGRHRIFSFTWELYPPETATVWGDHYPPDEAIAPQTARNRTALLYLLDIADCPYRAIGRQNANCGAFFDDMEIYRGWSTNPDGTDTATNGHWARRNPGPTSSGGRPMQLDATVSGSQAIVTGGPSGASANQYDLDGGATTMRSAPIHLPAVTGPLTFRYYFAHGTNSSSADGFRVWIEGEDGTRTQVFREVGSRTLDGAAWARVTVPLTAWAGQTIRVWFGAVDGGPDSLVEAAVEDVRVERP